MLKKLELSKKEQKIISLIKKKKLNSYLPFDIESLSF